MIWVLEPPPVVGVPLLPRHVDVSKVKNRERVFASKEEESEKKSDEKDGSFCGGRKREKEILMWQ